VTDNPAEHCGPILPGEPEADTAPPPREIKRRMAKGEPRLPGAHSYKSGDAWKGGNKLAQYRRRMSKAVRGKLTHTEIQRTLEVLCEVRDARDSSYTDKLAACREILDRALGKAKVIEEITIDGGVTFEQRLLISRVTANLLRSVSDIPSDGTEVVDGSLEDSGQRRLPAPAGGVPAVREDSAVGDLLHPQRPEREGLHRQLDQVVEQAVEAPQPVDDGGPRESLPDVSGQEARTGSD
jgi:hypothetical protein